MHLMSLGYRTDLGLLELGGSLIEDHGDHLVIRSPHNPGHWWGNFLLLREVPSAEDTTLWLDRFADVFPDASHLAFGFDGTDGAVADLPGFASIGCVSEVSTVMTATSVRLPPRPNADATYRALSSDQDWAQHVALRVVCEDRGLDSVEYTDFVALRASTMRSLADSGHGGWFGAFVDGVLVSQMGLYAAGEGLARFQSVETHPDHRGRGLAGTLVHHVSRFGFDDLDARILVMVADPDYLAIRVYRSVGFTDSETQLQAERPPGAAGEPSSVAPAAPANVRGPRRRL